MLYLQIAISIYILCMFIFLLNNTRGYLEVPKPSTLPENPPLLSLVVPAGSTPLGLKSCLNSIGRQDYPKMEILIVDNPHDDHAFPADKIVREFAEEYHPAVLLHAEGSSLDWSGRTWLQHQGALRAQGEWIVFLDPNVVLQPTCLSQSLAYCIEKKVDFFSLMPGHDLRSFWEKLILPIVFGWFGTRFSIAKVNDPSSTQAVAVSQFMLIRKAAYQATGGFQKVRGEILEDSALAREIKNLGMRYRLLGGKHLLKSRVYGGLPEIWRIWMRIFVGEVGSNPTHLLWTVLVIGLTGIIPFLSVLWCAYVGIDTVNLTLLGITVGQCIMVLGARLVLDYTLGIGPFFAFLHPVGASFALAILFSSLYHTLFGNLKQVKGRVESEL